MSQPDSGSCSSRIEPASATFPPASRQNSKHNDAGMTRRIFFPPNARVPRLVLQNECKQPDGEKIDGAARAEGTSVRARRIGLRSAYTIVNRRRSGAPEW